MSGSKGQAAELVETMLTFIEQVSNRKLRFSSIVDLNTGKTSDPTDRLVFAIDAALRAAKVEGLREQQALLDEAYQVMSLWFKYFNSDIRPVDQWTEVVERVNAWLPLARDVRKARIADTEGQEGT